MAKVKITGHASGSGVLTITAPNTSTDRTITLPDATGTLLNSDGSGASLTGIPVTGLTSQQVFTSSGTWTKPTGITKVKVYVTGGGGGGGPCNSDDGANGGGAGGTAIEIIDVSSVSSVTVTVGAAGAGKANNGGTTPVYAGTSSFGSYCSATGGATSANGWSNGGFGGAATGGNINIPGGTGMNGTIDLTVANATIGGDGGCSFWGGGGNGSTPHALGSNALCYGAGGGGARITGTSYNGMTGIVVIEEYK